MFEVSELVDLDVPVVVLEATVPLVETPGCMEEKRPAADLKSSRK